MKNLDVVEKSLMENNDPNSEDEDEADSTEGITQTLALVSDEEDPIENSLLGSVEEVPETNNVLQQELDFLNSSWPNMVQNNLVCQGIGVTSQGDNTIRVDS